ncbi:hypothetical protein BH09BAC1_BH09BAC1_25600 [soil metagenome]
MKYYSLIRVFWVLALCLGCHIGFAQIPPPGNKYSANPVCPRDTTVEAQAGTKGAAVTYETPALILNGTANYMKMMRGIVPGAVFPVGTTQLVYQGIDDTGGFHFCRFNVVVIGNDITPTPIATIPTVLNPKHNLGTDTVTYEPKGITLNSCVVTLFGFDGREFDHDTVSIIFNDEVLVNRVEIVRKNSKKGIIKLRLNLLPGMPNTLILKAWNEGTIKPNTLSIEIYEADITKRSKTKGLKPILLELNAKPGLAKGIILNCK